MGRFHHRGDCTILIKGPAGHAADLQDDLLPSMTEHKNTHTFIRRKRAARLLAPSSMACGFNKTSASKRHGSCLASLTTAVNCMPTMIGAAAEKSSSRWLGLFNPPASREHCVAASFSLSNTQKGSSSAAAKEQHERAMPATRSETESTDKKTSSSRRDPFHSAKLLLSGAMSALVSRTCVAPLERVKMELVLKQNTGGAVATAAQVLRTEGIGGFWKGNALNVLRTAPFKAVNFFSFDSYHRALIAFTGEDGNVERFSAGAMAGITATLVCFPLDVVRTRLMSTCSGPRYGGLRGTLSGMIKHEGVAALYSGCLPAVIGMAPAGAVFYGVYDLLKHQHLEKSGAQGQQLPILYTLAYGAMAGAASELIVYPLEVVRRRMQIQSMAMAAARAAVARPGSLPHATTAAAAAAVAAAHPQGWARVMQVCRDIVRTDGFGGFYAGLAPNMLQVLPSAALSYYTYDTMKQVLGTQQ